MNLSILPPNEFLSLKHRAFASLIDQDKKSFRKTLQAERQNQDPRVAQYKSERICEQILQLPEIAAAKIISAYSPVRGEVNLLPLLDQLIKLGKIIALPQVLGNKMCFLQVNNLKEDLIDGAYGIREPHPERCSAIQSGDVDVFLIPGTGFDLFHGRIGFGGGYYDRVLKVKHPKALAIGLAFEFQVLHALPMEEHDQPINRVVTEEHLYTPHLSIWHSDGEEQTLHLAKTLYEYGFKSGGVIALHGDLGVGKTVFVNGLAQAIHALETPTSPTFVYCHEYHGDLTLYHIDGYRIEEIEPRDEEFWAELLEKKGLIAIEWAERVGTLLPKTAVHLLGEIVEGTQRRWTLYTPLQEQVALHKLSIC